MTDQPQHPSDDSTGVGQSPAGSAPHGTAPEGPAQPASEQPPTPQPYSEQTYAEQPYGEQTYGEQPSSEQPPAQGYAAPAYPQQGYGEQSYGQQVAPAPGYGQSGARPLTPTDEKTWAIAAHLSPFVASLVGLPFLGPLVIYLVFRDRGPFVRHHSAQALNFHIIVAIGLLISIPLMFILVGFVTAAIIAIGAIVFQIIAAIEANNGKWYRYPLTPNWVK